MTCFTSYIHFDIKIWTCSFGDASTFRKEFWPFVQFTDGKGSFNGMSMLYLVVTSK